MICQKAAELDELRLSSERLAQRQRSVTDTSTFLKALSTANDLGKELGFQ